MPIPVTEVVFRFIDPVRDWFVEDDGTERVSSQLFRDSEVSVNRSSVWSLADHMGHLASLPGVWGLCSFTCADLCARKATGQPDFTIEPQPLGTDPLLGVPNPAHCNLSRQPQQKEARRMAKFITENSQSLPRRPQKP